MRCLRLPISPDEIGDDTPLLRARDWVSTPSTCWSSCSSSSGASAWPIRDEETGTGVLQSVDTIPDYSQASARMRPGVSARMPAGERPHSRCRGVVPHLRRRRAAGSGSLGRAALARGNDDALAAGPARSRRRPATFFVVGWVARTPSALVEDDSRGRARGWFARLLAPAGVYDLGEDAFRDDLQRSVRALARCRRPGVNAFRAPEWSINNRSLWALDVLVEEGFALDASMAPLKIVGDPSFPRSPHRASHPRRVDCRSSAAGRGPVRSRHADGMGLGPADELAGSRPQGDRRGQQARAARRAHRASLGARPGSAAVAASGRGLHFAHYFRLGGFRERLAGDSGGSAASAALGQLAVEPSIVTSPGVAARLRLCRRPGRCRGGVRSGASRRRCRAPGG